MGELINSQRVKVALKLAKRAHREEVDDNGYSYVVHLIHIAKKMKTEDTCVAALLHDIFSTSVTLDEIKGIFTPTQVEAILLLQEPPLLVHSFTEYILAIKENRIASLVEIEFLKFHISLLKNEKKSISTKAKYISGIKVLGGDYKCL